MGLEQRRRVRFPTVLAMVGAALLLLCAPTFLWSFLYQQPPGSSTTPPGMVVPGGPPAPGAVRIRFSCGSLVVANGQLPYKGAGMSTLGYLRESGFHAWWWPWKPVTAASTWKFYFYREHIQVNVLLIGAALVLPWAIRRWVWRGYPKSACQACGYDLRGSPAGPCPECGGAVAG